MYQRKVCACRHSFHPAPTVILEKIIHLNFDLHAHIVTALKELTKQQLTLKAGHAGVSI